MSIKGQTYSNIEIIIIDGGSKDRSAEIGKEFGAKVSIQRGLSMSASTNYGANISNGYFVYRVDSDVILDEKLVEEAVSKCQLGGYDGVCIFWLPDSSISFWAKVRRIEKENYIKNPTCIGGKHYTKDILGARFLKHSVFDAVGGCDENIPIAGEDYAFYNKLSKSKFKFATIESRELHIGEPRHLSEVYKKNFRYGYTFWPFLSRQSREDNMNQFSPLRRGYLIKVLKQSFGQGAIYFLGSILYFLVLYVSTALGISYYALECIIKSRK
jgi:glycosyltransferase involved in cell wall biosynthesis